jgi:tape measure domain-containing protein
MADAKARIIIAGEDQTRAAFASVKNNLREMNTAVSQIRNVGAAVLGNEIVQSLGNGAKAIVTARIEVEKLNNVLGQAVGVGRVAQELAFIREAATRLGLEFQSTASSYAKFAAASRGTALEGQATRDIFTGIAQASTALGLSADETSGALLAVQQIISKGKVSAEELRGQLGERLPGAFQIAARSIGVTTQELDKLLVSGSLLADDFLPKFGRQLELEFAESAARAATSTQASVNKLVTAVGDLRRVLAAGPVGDAAAVGLSNLGQNLQNLAKFFRDADRASQSFFERLSNFAPPIGFTGIALSAGARNRAQDGAADANELARLQRRQGELPPQTPQGTASQIRAADNAIAASARSELAPLLQRFRSAEQIRREQIRELLELGAQSGTDVSAAVAELERRGATRETRQDNGAKAYVESLNEQVRTLRELSEVEKVRFEIEDGRLAKASAAQQLEATIAAAKLDDARRLSDAAEADLRRIERIEQANQEQGAAAEQERDRVRALADSYRELVDPAKRYRDELAKIRELEDAGELGPDTASRASSIVQRRLDDLAGLGREVKAADDATKQLGLTFDSAFEDAIINGKRFSDVLKGVVQDLARVAARELVTRPLFGSLLGLIGGGAGAGRPALANDLAGFNALPFADGGIMTSRGSVPLRRYAGGGVARSPQLAMFGEGSMAEAYVPLPDGRSIPVTVNGSAGTTLVVNVDARGSADVESVVRRAAAQGAQQAQALMFDRMNRTGAMA